MGVEPSSIILSNNGNGMIVVGELLLDPKELRVAIEALEKEYELIRG